MYIDVSGLNRDLLEAASAMGMTQWEKVIYVERRLAVPVIMTGIRVSTVYLIGWATLAAYIGGGGLGDYIFSGLILYRAAFLIGGAMRVTILALFPDLFLGRVGGR